MDETTKRHPIQPLETDARGVLRFKANAIVCYLLDNGGIDMNALARLDFTREDREQFAQLIGYSLDGAHSLGYMSDDTLDLARAERDELKPLDVLRDKLDNLRRDLQYPMAELFGIHPDDLPTPNDAGGAGGEG